MLQTGRRNGRLFCLALGWVLAAGLAIAQGPALTTVSDTVYRADGSPASGTLLISWPAFTTADGHTVAAGNNSVVLGSNGSLSVQLAPNAGATPSGTTYLVTYQLADGTVKTENWSVGSASPETISQVRTLVGTATPLTQVATQQYVNSQLATVVHLSGTETITGSKQFTVSPVLPTPSQAGQAATKAYVDNSVANVGSGSFVSKAGDAMSGPLTLPADPVSPNQASTKHYVDLNAASKADLVGGLVPVGELGSGVANNGSCLHGDSTWGGCGSGSGTGLTAGMLAIKYATDFAWTQSPSADLSSAGAKTVTLASCPLGVSGAEPQYYVYIAGTGTAEAALVTGGTCAGNGLSGTLQFTTANAHTAGYAVTSASSGLQEALIAARFTPTNPTGSSQSGKVVVPPGELKLFARVSIRASNITVDFSGSVVECWMSDTCIFVGDPANSNLIEDVTLLNPRGRPTISGGQAPFIEVNGQKTRLLNVSTRLPFSGGTFGTLVQVDDDQSFLLDGLDTALGGGLRCDSTFCGPAVYAPGPFNVFSAVGWLKNLNISLQCAGNGVDWESGNTLRISDSVIQGYAQYGVRTGTRRGGFGNTNLENVYEEVGNCSNPAGNIGEAGVIAQGATVRAAGGVGPAGNPPQFANTGSTDYRYYVVAHHATFGASNPLYAGNALTNGTGNIVVTTPDIAGASTLDLLRVTVSTLEQAPFGTGNYAVAANLARTSVCSNGVCTFTDTQAALQSYTVATPTYFPLITFWPGSIVLGSNTDSSSVLAGARAFLGNMPANIVGVAGTTGPSAVATNCDPLSRWTPIWLSCFSAVAPTTFYQQGALLLAVKPNNDGNTTLNLKGRLNFPTLGTAPSHIITLSDSNFQKTIATQNNRPNNDANDAFVGYDQGDGNPAHIGISFGAPKSLSNYIGNVGDGTSWLERLTPTLKEFKTNVQMDSALTVAGAIQANSFVSTGTGPWSLTGNFGTLSPAPANQSLIGFGANGKLQVSENGGSVLEVAKLDTSGNVATANALSQTPAQCSGSFATGIQANGNANCSTADQIQLAETTAPTGIPNYGIFWFDSTCHCPRVIDNNGQAVQLGLTNVFNQDSNGTNPSNTLEEVNGANPQALRVYGTWTNATNWERTGLAWDQTDGYFVLKNENLGTGNQHGIGLWIGSNIRWAVDTASVFKPFVDNSYSIGVSSLTGGASLRPKNIYAATSFDITGSGGLTFEPCNDSTTGTGLNFLAKYNTANPSCAVKAGTGDTDGVVGIVSGGSGTTGNAIVTYAGFAQCSFDGATTSGDYAVASTTNAGDCHDAGTTRPTSVQVIGRVLSTNGAAGTYQVFTSLDAPSGAGSGGAVSSVFGRTGAVLAASGDYSVTQVTNAAQAQSCTNKVLSAVNNSASSTNCAQITPSYAATVQGNGSAFQLASGSTTSGDFTSYDANGNTVDSGLKTASQVPWFTQPTATGTVSFLTSSNVAKLYGALYNGVTALTTTQVVYNVQTADNTSNTYDIGLYNSSGALVAHLGATAGTSFAPSTGWKTVSWASSATIKQGKYYLAITTNCTTSCAVLIGSSTGVGFTFAGGISESVTSGGTLPATITIPSDVFTATTVPSWSIQ